MSTVRELVNQETGVLNGRVLPPPQIKNKKEITEEYKMTFEKRVEFSSAFDKRHSDPSKNYGIGSVQIRFVLIGQKGATQAVFGTNWFLPETVKEYKEIGVDLLGMDGNRTGTKSKINLLDDERDCSGVSGWDLGYHAKEPQYPEQLKTECDLFSEGKCYYDGSGLRAISLPELLIRKGSDAIWKVLEEEYKCRFGTD